ncbi:MAG: bifunctional hydroxymethylpyrimidine kinase/phosphomethylpyrimidine kinase [Campylobacterales bacterium]|nr:bifunctional hydroxymethylpyrimidine kinase/phosphomethylpyrimidine kinase [Campylobacterales bacterium]
MKTVLTIAGSDSSGGAGIQADLKTFEAFGVYGASVLTVLTAQNTTGVQSIFPVDPSFVAEQIHSVLDDFRVDTIKIGMLYDAAIIETVRAIVEPLGIPIVLDPVCVSKAGSPLLKDDAIDALREFSKAVTLTTPNLHEAYRLFGYRSGDSDSLSDLIAHPSPVLIKGHVMDRIIADLLYLGRQKRVFTSQKIESTDLHGTGCTYSSAIAASLALGLELDHAIERAKAFVTDAILSAPSLGHGPGPLNHKAAGEYLNIRYKELP